MSPYCFNSKTACDRTPRLTRWCPALDPFGPQHYNHTETNEPPQTKPSAARQAAAQSCAHRTPARTELRRAHLRVTQALDSGLALAARPASFIGIEANQQAARVARDHLTSTTRIIVRNADDTGLESETASVVYGEALLTLQRPAKKRSMVNEAHRLLCTGGRFGIHELALVPDDIPEFDRQIVSRDLKTVLRGGALPT